MRFIKHLTTWFLLLTVLTASGLVNAKVASEPQILFGALHQAETASNWLWHQAKIDFSYDAASGSSVAPKRGGTGFKGSKGFELKNAPYQKVRNSPTTINGRDFSGHALDQMQNRGIMPSVVENTLKTGTSFPTRAGTSGFFDPVNKIRVITNSETGRVVTVIRGAPK